MRIIMSQMCSTIVMRIINDNAGHIFAYLKVLLESADLGCDAFTKLFIKTTSDRCTLRPHPVNS